MEPVESIPNAGRTFEALRSLGYDLNSSIADIIDNAITDRVRASKVAVAFGLRDDHFIVRVSDDGSGMSEAELEEAMRLGTETEYGEHDLGRFGMGMKTASLSHCNVLTVISKKRGEKIAGYRWDIRHIRDTDEWSLLKLDDMEIGRFLDEEEGEIGESGTAVFWDDMFKLDGEYSSYKTDRGRENLYLRLLGDLKLHIGMTYHRFLDGSLGEKNTLKLLVNDDVIEPWDPFCRDESNTFEVELDEELSEVKIPEHKKSVTIRAYILPNKEQFSTEKAWRDAKGLKSWNDSQGYYIYRANRLIRFGGWHRTKAKDEHDKYARVSIDIDPELDELFKINVNKTTVKFPDRLYQHLKHKVNRKITKKAQKRYRKSGEDLEITDKFRHNTDKIEEVSRELVEGSSIRTGITGDEQQDVSVTNAGGEFISNRVQEFLEYGTESDYEVVSGRLDNGRLWRTVCYENEKFKVVVNADHPFYSEIYSSGRNGKAASAVDALVLSLAFAELFNRNEENSHLFDMFNKVCSKTLAKLVEEEAI